MKKLSDKDLEYIFKKYVIPGITEHMKETIKSTKKRDEKLMKAFQVKK
jgi:hypothetical protein